MTIDHDIPSLLDELAARGVHLWLEQDVLRFRAPQGALSEAMRMELLNRRDAVIAELRSRSTPGRVADASGVSTAEALLARLTAMRVALRAEAGQLKVDAPKGAIDEALRLQISQHKAALVHLLSARDASQHRHDASPGRADRSRPLPVSHMQRRLWFLKQLDPGNAAYNIPCAIRFRGDIDAQLVERTLADLCQRHESLRTRFVAFDGVPRCVIEPSVATSFDLEDLRALEPEEREATLQRRLLEIPAVPFDISRAPLWRATLIRLGESDWVLLLVVDHIIADGLSIAILLDEFRRFYVHHRTGVPANLGTLSAQYVDLVALRRDDSRGDELASHLEFWKKQLEGLPSALQLPTDRPRPSVQTYRGNRVLRVLAPDLPAAIRAMARSSGATPFMITLAAFQTLLHRYAGVEDLAVGTAVSNRNSEAAERVVGFFANNVVLRGDLSGNPSVEELLRRTRDVCVRSMEHQEMPFDLLVDALVARRETDHSPLFQVLFVLQSWVRNELPLAGATGEVLVVPTSTARYDLSVDLFDMPEGMAASFEYNADLFDAETIERMAADYERILRQMLAYPEKRVGDIELLGEAERRQVLVEWNQTRQSYPSGTTIHALFEEQARLVPGAIALIFEGQSLTYTELNSRANRLAHHLRGRSVGCGSLVGVLLERSIDMVVAVLGILKAGAAYVPLDPAFPQDRIDYMMGDAGLAAVITQRSLAETFPSRAPCMVLLDADQEAIALEATGDPTPASRSSDLAYVIYTSGSTGRPKAVMLEHRSVVNFLLSMHRRPGIDSDDRFVAVTTLSFDIAGLELYGPLSAGGTVVLASRATALDGADLASLLERCDATLLQATPATWRLLVESGWRGKAGLKMLCGGEMLQRDLARRLLELGGELWNMYGPTETTIWSTIWRVTDVSRTIPIGTPIANTQVYVLEPTGQPAPIGVAGELLIGGDGLARGYLGHDDLTAEKFVHIDLPMVGPTRLYRTGDLARWRADGCLEYVGRRDHQVKVRGYRIELGEIEAVLATHAGVRENVVHVREDTPGDQRLVAYVVMGPGCDLDIEAARATLRKRLPEYMVPNHFVSIGELPLTPNGKVDRKALPAPSARTITPFTDEIMTPEQEKVAAIWREVLNVERVSLLGNFFDVGGHSLLLVRLQAALQNAFGRSLPLLELFQHTTVAAQAARLGGMTAGSAAMDRARARAARQLVMEQ